MSATLMPPPADHENGGGPGTPEPPVDHDPGGRGRWPGRRALAALLCTAALLGGTVAAGVLAATGAIGGGSSTTTTTVVRASSAGGSTLDASAVYTAASAGVVDITATGTTSTQSGPFGGGSSQSSQATGSGFVVDGQGTIVTAAHVVDGASSIKVSFSDGTTRTATLLGKDDATDVAVLKVDPSGLTLHPLTLGSSTALKVGDAVAAIGSPFGYQESFSTGVVSGLDRTIQAPNGFTVAHAIQTDAAINPGNSGGPILDANGHVIGIADQIATDGSSEQSSGVGFAVPIDTVKSVVPQLKSNGRIERAWLGVSTGDAPTRDGALVGDVTGAPAQDGGIQPGDLIVQFDGRTITSASDLGQVVLTRKPGDTVKVVVERNGNRKTLTVKLGTRPNQPTQTIG